MISIWALRDGWPFLTEAGRLFERVGDLKDAEIVFVAADDLNAHRESFRCETGRYGGRWIARY